MSKKRYLATLDIETSDGLKGSNFAVGGFYIRIGNSKPIPVIEKDKNKFFEEVFNVCSQVKKVLCFIHNEDFDIRFVLDYCLKELKINPFIIQSNSRILEVRINTKDYDVIFRDSFQFLLCSQDIAEETFLEKKIKIDVNFIKVLKDFNSSDDYLSNRAYRILRKRVESDIIGLYEVLLKFKELFNLEFRINPFRYVTLPSLSIAIFRKYLKADFNISFASINPYLELSKKKRGYSWRSKKLKILYDWTRNAYFGGRCEVFDFNYLEKTYYYDFNSLYPSMCIKEKFPTPTKYFMMENPSVKYFLEKIRGKRLYIIEAKVTENNPFPILPLRDLESVKFVNGEKTGVWASPEFEEFLNNEENTIIEIIRIRVYTECRGYLKTFMFDRYENRKQYDYKDLKPQSFIEKIVMNSLTGKPAQKPKREGWVLWKKKKLS